MSAGTLLMRVSKGTHAVLHQLAQEENCSMQEVLSKAVEAYRRQQIIDATNAGYAALQADPQAWREFQEEIHALDGVLADGLDDSNEVEAAVATG